KLGCKNILLKGGHQTTEKITSLFYSDNDDFQTFESLKLNTKNTHGSGCTLSSAIASFIAQGKSMDKAVALAQNYVSEAILEGSDVQTGKGNGPLNHFFNPQKLIKNELV
ncbi:MAG TPA: bifunctional hydroxymethylpyrimidine kinase/phosphomethylpyrimidine kinase, partial [Chryseobacterium sp.]